MTPEAGQTRLEVLAEASHAFASTVTDYPALLARIARLTADRVGDGCLVTLVEGDMLVSAASAHRDAALDDDYRAFLGNRQISKVASNTVAGTVIRSGAPVYVSEIDPTTIVAQTEVALRPIAERLDVRSLVVVPIRARGTTIGSLSLFRSGPGRNFTKDDTVMLGDLADRAGLAIENARLYGELERRVRERTAALETANSELEAFSHSVAHDLRAPLRAVDGFAQAALEDADAELGDIAKAHIARVRNAARTMGTLIDDLLSLSQVSRKELKRERVDLSEIAQAVLLRIREAHPERDVKVVVAPKMIAEGDARLLDVVLTNLIGNAWKFTSKKDDPRIELGASGDVFFVRDNGAGFDPLYAKKLFGTFERLHSTRDFEGTGIGLATVARIVKRHGGRVWAEGQVDHGATFSFTLGAY